MPKRLSKARLKAKRLCIQCRADMAGRSVQCSLCLVCLGENRRARQRKKDRKKRADPVFRVKANARCREWRRTYPERQAASYKAWVEKNRVYTPIMQGISSGRVKRKRRDPKRDPFMKRFEVVTS